MLFFSPSAAGFLDDAVHSSIPADAVTVSTAEHAELVAARSTGATLQVRDGRVVAVPRRLTLAERRDRCAAIARADARQRILAIADQDRQSNDNALMALAALDGDRSPELAAALDRRAAIDAVRAACRTLEANIATGTGAALAALDPTHAGHWPN